MEKKSNFYQKYGYLLSMIFIISGFLFLFGNILTCELEIKNEFGDIFIQFKTLNILDLFNPTLSNFISFVHVPSLLFISLILTLIFGLFHFKTKREKSDCLLSIAIFSLLICICFLFIYKEIFPIFGVKFEYSIKSIQNGWGLVCCIIFLFLSVLVDLSLGSFGSNSNVKVIAEDGILIAIAFVLNFIKIPIAIGGGSINLQILPLMIIAIRRGPLHSFICGGLIFGLLSCAVDGYGFATYPFDYLIGFGSIAAVGFFKNFIVSNDQITYNLKGEIFIFIGGFLATIIRFFGSSISSIVVYDFSFVESLIYNAVYIPISGFISTSLLMIIYGPFLRINNKFSSNN